MAKQDETRVFNELAVSVELGRPKDTEKQLLNALEAGYPAEQLIRRGLMPGMRNVGAEFKNDEADIPKLLCAARAMQQGIETLQPYLKKGVDVHIGKAIIGTVEGDLHEVGKNLVVIMFRSVGFDVIDLGVDVSEKQFVKAVQEHPDTKIVCVSSLLTTTMAAVREVVRRVRNADKNHEIKIMVGGGSVTEAFAKEIGADAYTENAVDAAELGRALVFGDAQETVKNMTNAMLNA